MVIPMTCIKNYHVAGSQRMPSLGAVPCPPPAAKTACRGGSIMKPWKSLLLVSTTAFGIGVANGGNASAADRTDTPTQTPPALQEVIVTAANQPQPLQDAALAVTAITNSQLGNLGATNFSDY